MAGLIEIHVEIKVDSDVYKRRLKLPASEISAAIIHEKLFPFIQESREDSELFANARDFKFRDEQGYDLSSKEISEIIDGQRITMTWKGDDRSLSMSNMSITSQSSVGTPTPSEQNNSSISEASVVPKTPIDQSVRLIGYPEEWKRVNFTREEAINVIDILESSINGRKLLLKIRTNKDYVAQNLTEARKNLINYCGDWLMANCKTKNQPDKTEKAKMAFSIVQEYPELRSKKDPFGWGHLVTIQPCTGSGYLDFSIYNKRKLLPQAEKRPYTKAIAEDSSECTTDPIDEEQYQVHRQYAASTRPTPLTVVSIKEAMAATRSLRQEKIQANPKMTITDNIGEFPRFVDTPDLLVDELEYVLTKSGRQKVNIIQSWTEVISVINSLAFKESSKSQALAEILLKFNVRSQDDLMNLIDESSSLLALMALSYLIKPTSFKTAGKTVRPSSNFALSRLLQFFQAGTPHPEVVENLKREQITQPLLVIQTVNGQLTPEEPASVIYLLLDNKLVNVPGTIARAIQQLIAVYYSFNVEYPLEVKTIYHVLELIFGMVPSSLSGKRARMTNKSGIHNSAYEMKTKIEHEKMEMNAIRPSALLRAFNGV